MRPSSRRMLEIVAVAALLITLPTPTQASVSGTDGCLGLREAGAAQATAAASTHQRGVAVPDPASGWSLHLVGEGHPAEEVLGMAVTGPSSASVVWQGEHALRVALTTDGGATWPTVIKFADPGNDTSVSMASSGQHIDILMTDQHTGRAIYRRSDDAGLTWTDPVLLGKVARSEYDFPTAVVGRAADGRVAAAWWWKGGRLVVKVSHDGGGSFGFAHTVARGHPPTGGCAGGPGLSAPLITLGRGVILVSGEVIGAGDIGVMRSVDGGATWSKPAGLGYLRAMVAHGPDVVVGIDDGLARVSHDRGKTWSTVHRAVDGYWYTLGWSDGHWRIATHGDTRMFYRDSTDGVHWSERSTFASGEASYQPGAVATLHGHPVILYAAWGLSPSYPDQRTVAIAIKG